MLGKTQTLPSKLVPRSGASERAERFFNKLKHFRAVATRYEKRDADYLALVKTRRHPNTVPIHESVT
jgi:hypothetical protein